MPEREKAVAVGYDPAMPAPQVLARGSGTAARRIVELARENGIPLHEDADMVEVLQVLGEGECVPVELYEAFAVLLSSLYNVNQLLGRDHGRKR